MHKRTFLFPEEKYAKVASEELSDAIKYLTKTGKKGPAMTFERNGSSITLTYTRLSKDKKEVFEAVMENYGGKEEKI